MNLKHFRTATHIPAPRYVHKPYVILSKENVVLDAGTAAQLRKLSTYFDDCRVEARRYDLYMNDNTRIAKA